MDVYAVPSILVLLPLLVTHQLVATFVPHRQVRQADSSNSDVFSTCVVQPSRNPGICRLISNCSSVLQTLRKTAPTICGWLNLEPIVCCPNASPPLNDTNSSNSDVDSSCVLQPSRNPGVCRLISNCSSVLQTLRKTVPTICGWLNLEPIVCCPHASLPLTNACARSTNPAHHDTISPSIQKHTKRMLGEEETVGLEVSLEGSRPWMAALIGTSEASIASRLLCGGTVIGPQHVLTAASCFIERTPTASHYEVAMGSTNLSDPKLIIASVSSILLHPDVGTQHLYNDIALIHLDHPLTFNNRVRPACLPSPEYRNTALTGSRVLASGWGRTGFVNPPSEVLQEVMFRIDANSRCEKVYNELLGESGLHNYGEGITADLLCTGHRTDSCLGGSGGPLMYTDPISKHWIVIGVKSLDFLCLVSGLPGIYTRVTSYLEWIHNNMK